MNLDVVILKCVFSVIVQPTIISTSLGSPPVITLRISQSLGKGGVYTCIRPVQQNFEVEKSLRKLGYLRRAVEDFGGHNFLLSVHMRRLSYFRNDHCYPGSVFAGVVPHPIAST